MEMEAREELIYFIKLCFIAISSICYCYFISSRISHGFPRLLSLLPIIAVFSVLPLPFSYVHLALPAFFYLVWLGNFKLLLFAYNRGPLYSTPRLPILTFISVALLPINPKQPSYKKIKNPFPFSLPKPIMLSAKAMILVVIMHIYQYKDDLHSFVVVALYFSHMYIGYELGFAIAEILAKVVLGFGFEIELQFNEPYLATSLQDLWGRRWNLVSSSILRESVYNPIRAMSTPTLGRFWSQQLGIVMTFVVSGLMHELMYFYLMRVQPTWEVTWFFVVHGVFMAAEVAAKRAVNDRFRLNGLVSGLLTFMFVLVTGFLHFEQPLRNGVDVKVINECSILLKKFRLIK